MKWLTLYIYCDVVVLFALLRGNSEVCSEQALSLAFSRLNMFTASLPAIISLTERRCSLLALEQNGGRLETFHFMQEVCAPDEVLEAAQVATGTLVTAANTLHSKETDRQSYTHLHTQV